MTSVSELRRAVTVLSKAGLLHPWRPDRTVRSLATSRRRGPLVAALESAVHAGAGRAAVADELGTLTFAELDRMSNALAHAWLARGARAGTVFGLLCRDHRWTILALLAAAKLGGTVVPMNTGFSAPQLADVAARENVSILVHDEEFADVVPDGPQRFLGWAEAGAAERTLAGLIADGDPGPVPPPAKAGGTILLTSGTTGTPRGTARNARSPMVSTQLLDRIPLRPGEATFIGSPIFHATGFAHFALAIALGSTIVVRRRFDATETLRAVERHRCSTMILVPTMLRRILGLGPEELARHDLSRLRILFCAGSALPVELGDRAVAAFGDVLYNLYGSTEVAVATVAMPEDWLAAPGTVGKPPVGCRVRLFDDHDRPVAQGEVGRIFVTNGLRFAGYTDGGTKDVIDGMVATGDLGCFDAAGRLFVVGRADDMIVSGGENVYPGEVEELLASHEHIVEAAVVGVPDEEFGQRLRAYVVPVREGVLTAEDVTTYVRAALARHKVPRDVVFCAELPRNATGKVVRGRLSELDPSG